MSSAATDTPASSAGHAGQVPPTEGAPQLDSWDYWGEQAEDEIPDRIDRQQLRPLTHDKALLQELRAQFDKAKAGPLPLGTLFWALHEHLDECGLNGEATMVPAIFLHRLSKDDRRKPIGELCTEQHLCDLIKLAEMLYAQVSRCATEFVQENPDLLANAPPAARLWHMKRAGAMAVTWTIKRLLMGMDDD